MRFWPIILSLWLILPAARAQELFGRAEDVIPRVVEIREELKNLLAK